MEKFEPISLKNPKRQAMILHKRGVHSVEYYELQRHRMERLEFFKQQGIQVIINDAQILVDFGKAVFDELERLEGPH